MQAPTDPPTTAARLVDYQGSLEQALQDLVAWVEQGRAPSPTTAYTVDGDQRLTMAPTAPDRGGIQPVVVLTADGGGRAEVGAGDAVTFVATAEAPPGAGSIIAVEWDFEGKAEWNEP